MSTSLQQLFVSNELLQYQENSLLRIGMIQILKEAKGNPSFTGDLLNESKLPKLIKKYTGLSIVFKSFKTYDYDMCVRIPILSKSNILNTELDIAKSNIQSIGDLKNIVTTLEATVDIKKGRVTGMFTNIPVVIIMGDAYWDPKGVVNSEEISAMLLHEIGHFFCYCLYMIETVRTNLVLSSLNRLNYYESDRPKKIKILGELEQVIDIKLRDKETLSTTSKDVVYSVLISNTTSVIRSETNAPLFDERTYEFLADQFASMHGAGKDLAIGLSKLQKLFGIFAKSTMEKNIHNLYNLTKFTGGILSGYVLLIMTMRLLSNKVEPSMYDSPNVRLNKIKEQYIGQLRNKNLSVELKKQLIDDIRDIENIIKLNIELSDFSEFFYKTVLPWERKRNRVAELQHDYETLAYNPLYKTSAQLTV